VQLDKFDEIESRRKTSKKIIENIITGKLPEVHGVKQLSKQIRVGLALLLFAIIKNLRTGWWQYLEKNKIQTRNYFAGNILMHPGYAFLDDYKNYPEANKVLDKVFFIGAAPHYGETVFDYIEEIINKF